MYWQFKFFYAVLKCNKVSDCIIEVGSLSDFTDKPQNNFAATRSSPFKILHLPWHFFLFFFYPALEGFPTQTNVWLS